MLVKLRRSVWAEMSVRDGCVWKTHLGLRFPFVTATGSDGSMSRKIFFFFLGGGGVERGGGVSG